MRISRSHYGLVFGVLVPQGEAAQVPEPIIDSPSFILHGRSQIVADEILRQLGSSIT